MTFGELTFYIESYVNDCLLYSFAQLKWLTVSKATVMLNGSTYSLSVNKAVTLTWGNLSVDLHEGRNSFQYFTPLPGTWTPPDMGEPPPYDPPPEPEPEPEPEPAPTPTPTPPMPERPAGTFAGLFSFMATLVSGLAEFFDAIVDAADGIPLIGNSLSSPFRWVRDYLLEIYVGLDSFDTTAIWADSALASILSWDAISSGVRATFFGEKAPLTWFRENFINELWGNVPWLTDPIGEWWSEIQERVIPLIPTDFVYPWEVWDNVVDGVRDLISEIDIPYVPTFDEIADWFMDRFDDVRELSNDPVAWFNKIFMFFLGVAAWPFLRALEDFFNRMFWEDE